MEPTLCMVRDGLALTSSKWYFKAVAPDCSPVEFRGRGCEVMRQQPDGSWLTHIDNPRNEVEVPQPDEGWVELSQSPWSEAALKQVN